MWFSSWSGKRTVSRNYRPARRFRPAIEVLESRAVPAVLLVNTTLDVLGHANGMLSLRQAIIDANAAPKPDTIVVPGGVYTLTLAGTAGSLDITGQLTIKGAGAGANRCQWRRPRPGLPRPARRRGVPLRHDHRGRSRL